MPFGDMANFGKEEVSEKRDRHAGTLRRWPQPLDRAIGGPGTLMGFNIADKRFGHESKKSRYWAEPIRGPWKL